MQESYFFQFSYLLCFHVHPHPSWGPKLWLYTHIFPLCSSSIFLYRFWKEENALHKSTKRSIRLLTASLMQAFTAITLGWPVSGIGLKEGKVRFMVSNNALIFLIYQSSNICTVSCNLGVGPYVHGSADIKHILWFWGFPEFQKSKPVQRYPSCSRP